VATLAPAPAGAPASTDSRLIGRVLVLGVAFAGAVALGSAAIVAGPGSGGLALLAAVVAVAGGAVWWYRPRAGYWMLLVDGVLTMTLSGVGLARGAVPWLLVAFWGGSALLLAAVMHLTAGAGRSGTVTLVAVISLLALSALGLGQYVRATWPPSERAILEQLPTLLSAEKLDAVWTAKAVPAPGGAWTCGWRISAPREEALVYVKAALAKGGWRIDAMSASKLSAEKNGDHLDVVVATVPDASGQSSVTSSQGTQLVATVSHVAMATTSAP
jgi:hypothetical protein